MNWNFTPEHIHLLLNHVPLLVLGAGFFVLAAGLARRAAGETRLGLVVVLLAALATPLVVWSGEKADDRMHLTLDPDGDMIAEQHEHRADKTEVALYATLALAAAALFFGRANDANLRRWALATAAVAIVALAMVAWTASLGGQIRHTELRPGGAPQPPAADSDSTH